MIKGQSKKNTIRYNIVNLTMTGAELFGIIDYNHAKRFNLFYVKCGDMLIRVLASQLKRYIQPDWIILYDVQHYIGKKTVYKIFNVNDNLPF